MNKYSEQFVSDCKEVYPDYEALHKHLDANNYIAGRYLDDCSYGVGVSLKEILEATSLESLQYKAVLHQRKIDLYKRWSEEVKGWQR